MDFQCLNTISQVFDTTYIVTFSTNRVSQNVVFSIFTTYVNNPDFSQSDELANDVDLILLKLLDHTDTSILHNNDFCIDDSTSRKQLEIFSGNSTINSTTTKKIDTFCANGCDNQTGKCNLTSSQSDILFIVIIIVLIGFFLYARQRWF